MNTRSRLEKLEEQLNPQGANKLMGVGSRPGETREKAFEPAKREKPGGTHYVYTGVPEGTQ